MVTLRNIKLLNNNWTRFSGVSVNGKLKSCRDNFWQTVFINNFYTVSCCKQSVATLLLFSINKVLLSIGRFSVFRFTSTSYFLLLPQSFSSPGQLFLYVSLLRELKLWLVPKALWKWSAAAAVKRNAAYFLASCLGFFLFHEYPVIWVHEMTVTWTVEERRKTDFGLATKCRTEQQFYLFFFLWIDSHIYYNWCQL